MEVYNWLKITAGGAEVVMISLWMRIFNFFETPEIRKINYHPRLHLYGTFNLWRKYCGVSWKQAKQIKSFEILELVGI